MTKTDLVSAIAQEAGISKKNAKIALDAFVQCVNNSLSTGEDVVIVGFGKYYVSERNARTVRNPKTGEERTISARKYPRFNAGKLLKDVVNNQNITF